MMEGVGKEVINLETEGESDKNTESATTQTDNSNAGTSSKRPRLTRAVKELLTNSNNEFMSNFDPESSNREKRKLTRKFTLEAKKNGSIYDENGLLHATQKDVCDCLIEDCPGCHFPCPKCRSCKCGIECSVVNPLCATKWRLCCKTNEVNRKWSYEVIENEGELSLQTNNPVPAT